MPLYFFNADDEAYPDTKGTMLANIDEARVEAGRFCGELLKDAGMSLWKGGSWSLRVSDEGDQTLFVMNFVLTMGAAPP